MPDLSRLSTSDIVFAVILLVLFLLAFFVFIILLLYLNYKQKPSEDGYNIDEYIEDVSQLVGGSWQETAEKNVANDKEFEISAKFVISKKGEITKVDITHSSDDETIDEMVVNAIKRTENIPSLPSGYSESELEIEMTFQNM